MSLGELCGGELPFLFKILAADKPLSIQAHPNLEQAREGFEKENRAGIPPDGANRNYRDSGSKPEIICALTPFQGLCGFREPGEIRRLLLDFLSPPAGSTLQKGFAPLLAALDSRDCSAALRGFLAALFALPPNAREALTAHILAGGRQGAGAEENGEWALMRRFAELYPGDPALVSPLYLNIIRLEPGEAVFLPARTLHAYIHGMGVELMANSDNVLRGGLTPKYVDVPELMGILDFHPLLPEILRPVRESSASCPARLRYPAGCGSFSLSVIHGRGGEITMREAGPAIAVVTRGEPRISGGDGGETLLKTGESIFIPQRAGKTTLGLNGNFTLYIAGLPDKPGP
jgi:mannose-6-phosphate isomerase